MIFKSKYVKIYNIYILKYIYYIYFKIYILYILINNFYIMNNITSLSHKTWYNSMEITIFKAKSFFTST